MRLTSVTERKVDPQLGRGVSWYTDWLIHSSTNGLAPVIWGLLMSNSNDQIDVLHRIKSLPSLRY